MKNYDLTPTIRNLDLVDKTTQKVGSAAFSIVSFR